MTSQGRGKHSNRANECPLRSSVSSAITDATHVETCQTVFECDGFTPLVLNNHTITIETSAAANLHCFCVVKHVTGPTANLSGPAVNCSIRKYPNLGGSQALLRARGSDRCRRQNRRLVNSLYVANAAQAAAICSAGSQRSKTGPSGGTHMQLGRPEAAFGLVIKQLNSNLHA